MINSRADGPYRPQSHLQYPLREQVSFNFFFHICVILNTLEFTKFYIGYNKNYFRKF